MKLVAGFLALPPLALAAPSNPMCQVSPDAGLDQIISVLGAVTTARCFINDYESLSDNFKKAISLELQPKSEGGIVFGDEFVWENGPSDWFSRVTLFESHRRLYSNATASNVPPGVAKYILGYAFKDSVDSPLELRSLLLSRARQCNNGAPTAVACAPGPKLITNQGLSTAPTPTVVPQNGADVAMARIAFKV